MAGQISVCSSRVKTTTTTLAQTGWRPLVFFVRVACDGLVQRAAQRLEQQSVAAALAAATHQSAHQNGAPRRPKTATRAREEVAQATHEALRGQETLPPGIR